MLLIGAPGTDTAGRAYVVPRDGWRPRVSLDEDAVALRGEEAGDGAGYRVAGAGDVDGDGFFDLIVGAIENDAAGRGAGAAYLVRGPLIGGNLGEIGSRLAGEGAQDAAGSAVDGAGDVDGDGLSDVIVGAYNHGFGGAAYLVRGPADAAGLGAAEAKFVGLNDGDGVGYSVAGAGDVDDDGYDDVLVGAPFDDRSGHDAGAAALWYGPVAGTFDLDAADVRLLGPSAGGWTGLRVGSAGDVDGDGYDDVLVGSKKAGVHLVRGVP